MSAAETLLMDPLGIQGRTGQAGVSQLEQGKSYVHCAETVIMDPIGIAGGIGQTVVGQLEQGKSYVCC